MNTSRISIVVSLILLSSASYAKQDRYHEEGVVIGKELCKDISYGGATADTCPLMKEVITTFSTCEPSSRKFKDAFADLKKLTKGIKQAANQSYSNNAVLVKAIAEAVLDSNNIGQVFIKIGNHVKNSDVASFNYPTIPRYNLQLNTYSQAYTLGKDGAKQLCTVVTDYATAGNYKSSANELQMTVMSLMMYFQMKVDMRGFPHNKAAASEIYNAVSGCKAGLKAYPLKRKLASVKPVKAIFVRFIHAQLLNVVSMIEAAFNGGSLDSKAFGDTFIKCGKELEAIS